MRALSLGIVVAHVHHNTLSKMAGILFRMDGTHELVSFDGTDLASCKAVYEHRAVSTFDVDLVDVRGLQQSDGSIEYVSCIYDTAAGAEFLSGRPLQINKNFCAFGSCIGDVLMFKTAAASSSFEDMTDRVLPSIGVSACEGVEILQQFSERLTRFVAAEKCTMAYKEGASPRTLFPFLMKRVINGKKQYYECCGFDGILMNSIEVDLLTFKTKRRRLTGIAAAGFDVEFFESMCRTVSTKRNVQRFCVVCKETTRYNCSRCKAYYTCGSAACRVAAWKIHKKDCIAK